MKSGLRDHNFQVCNGRIPQPDGHCHSYDDYRERVHLSGDDFAHVSKKLHHVTGKRTRPQTQKKAL